MTVSNSTDTNQASEDMVRDLVMRAMRYANLLSPRKLNEPVDPIVNDAIGGTVADIKAIIRNEKLKLLAEVRERVVGEDFKNWGELDTEEQAIQAYVNHLQAEQRDNLTKLEAEL